MWRSRQTVCPLSLSLYPFVCSTSQKKPPPSLSFTKIHTSVQTRMERERVCCAAPFLFLERRCGAVKAKSETAVRREPFQSKFLQRIAANPMAEPISVRVRPHLVTFLLQVSSPPYDDSYGKISITARNCCHLPA